MEDMHKSAHSKLITSQTFRFIEPFDLRKLHLFYGKLLWESDGDMKVLRSKGVIRISGTTKEASLKHVVQAVHETFEIEASQEAWENSDEESRIVFIGTHLDEARIAQGLAAATVKAHGA